MRRRGRSKLQFQEVQLDAILGSIADGVAVQDAEGRVVYANGAVVEALGLESAEEAVGMQLEELLGRFDVLDESGRPPAPDRLPGRLALAGDDEAEVTLRLRSRDARDERWMVVKARPIRDKRGTPTMAINIFEDVTEHKRAEQEQRFLAESSRVLASSLDYSATLGRLSSLVVPDIADWCAVDVVTPDGSLSRVALAHVDPEKVRFGQELRRRYPPDPSAPIGPAHVVRTGEPELYPEIADELLAELAEDGEHLRLLRGLGFRSAMVVPMIARGRTLGAITLVTAESGRRLGESGLELATELARRAAIAVDNARIYGERAHIARTLQESLLPPQLPQIDTVELAARFRAAGEANEVGGDFYDVFAVAGGRWAVVMGDVCGKGADAAAMTALTRYTIRTAAMQAQQPSQVLGLLNEAMLREPAEMQVCTVAMGLLEPGPEGAVLEVASAGHPLPMVLRGGGGVEQLGDYGTLLGAIEKIQLADTRVELALDDTLVFFTDGVTDAYAPEHILDLEELRALIAACVGLDANGIAERVEQGALASGQGDPRDDIAILVLQVRGGRELPHAPGGAEAVPVPAGTE